MVATEDFNGSPNGTLLTTHSINWTATYNNLQINSNECGPQGGGESACEWNAESFSGDQFGEATVSANTSSGSRDVGPAVRCQGVGSGSYYGFYGYNVESFLFRMNEGTFTELSSFGDFDLNDVVRIEMIGSTVQGMINGVIVDGPSEDSTHIGGAVGVCSFGSLADLQRIDDWSGGSLSRGTASSTAPMATSSASAQVTFERGYSSSKSRRRMMTLQSNVGLTADAATGILLDNVPISDFPHCFLSVTLYEDTAGQVVYTPTGGETQTITVEIKTVGSEYWEDPVSVLNVNDLATASWNANTDAIRVTSANLSGLAGVQSWSVTVTANRT